MIWYHRLSANVRFAGYCEFLSICSTISASNSSPLFLTKRFICTVSPFKNFFILAALMPHLRNIPFVGFFHIVKRQLIGGFQFEQPKDLGVSIMFPPHKGQVPRTVRKRSE